MNEESSALYRMKMVRNDLAAAGIYDELVLRAFSRIPREKFVPEGTGLAQAYGNHPYPIGHGQTVSQPFIVALMIQMMQCRPGDRVLEIGTGSGYQTAILADMGLRVVTVELLPELAMRAAAAVEETVPDGEVSFIVADGYHGWPPGAPYDGIVVSAAPKKVPETLEKQLSSEGGRLVIPAGAWSQRLMVITRQDHDFTLEESLPVRFVPLVSSTESRTER